MAYENKEFYIDCDGIDIHAKLDFPNETKEKMPILVVIPGFTGHIEEDHIIAVAKAANEVGFVTLRAEMYGHGKSGGEFKYHNVLLWMMEAARVVRYARNLDFVSDVYLSGHSQGGLTAVLAAGIMADVIKALIPLSPAMNIPFDARRGSMLGNAFNNEDLPDEVSCPDWTLSSDYTRVARVLPINECIEMFKKPVLVIHGTEDEAVPYKFGAELSKQYANGKLVSIEGDDHCYDYHLDEVTKALKEFLISQS
ncbi:MAG: alpha/beta fold hydrolase [Lachnospiraceae bacterium]|nr:alpha/beta fold hydrolase [Lachnospiraceae bacterium]